MHCRAKRHHEISNILANPVLYGTLQRNRNHRRAGTNGKARKISRKDVPQTLERIFSGKGTGNQILKHQIADGQRHACTDDFHTRAEHHGKFSGSAHFAHHRENIERQKRDDHLLNGEFHDLPELIEALFQSGRAGHDNADTHHERQQQCCQDVAHRRDLQFNERSESLPFGSGRRNLPDFQIMREQCRGEAV